MYSSLISQQTKLRAVFPVRDPPADQNLHCQFYFGNGWKSHMQKDAESSSYRGLNRRLNGGSDLAFFLTSFVSNSAT